MNTNLLIELISNHTSENYKLSPVILGNVLLYWLILNVLCFFEISRRFLRAVWLFSYTKACKGFTLSSVGQAGLSFRLRVIPFSRCGGWMQSTI